MKRNASEPAQHPASYRDPSGFVVRVEGKVYRQVNRAGAADYDRLLGSGLYKKLISNQWLIPHTETEDPTGWAANDRYKTLLPEQIPFISYAAEWSPDQLRDAGLHTLDVLEMSMEYGMILKDASPSNIQFVGGAPLFIDTLSFTGYDVSNPWVGYRQFCENFLYPLYIHRYLRTGVHRLFAAWPEGIPASVTAGLLPLRSRLRAGVWMHVLLPGKVKQGTRSHASVRFSKEKLLRIVSNLRYILRRLDLEGKQDTVWSGYYREIIGGPEYLRAKEELLRAFLTDLRPDRPTILDLGSNDGQFTRVMAEYGGRVLAVDADWLCIDRLYRETRKTGIPNILPLCADLSNPPPSGGFRDVERTAFNERSRSELVVALALIHHLVLGKNIPLQLAAGYLDSMTNDRLIVEFVPIGDVRAQELLRNKSDWHRPYDREAFERSFSAFFTVDRCDPIGSSERILYRMKKRTG